MKQPIGTKVGMAKLTEDQVREIRRSTGVSQRELGRRYGVSQTCIRDILLRKNWKNVH